MHVLMYEPRFVPLVRRGDKTHTIRPRRKRPIRTGDAIAHRCWRGVAYRSKQRQINQGFATRVLRIHIGRWASGEAWIEIIPAPFAAGHVLSREEAIDLARCDGFDSAEEFLRWREAAYGLPWSGELIQWRNVPLSLWRKEIDARN
jgi:hypothetical protein